MSAQTRRLTRTIVRLVTALALTACGAEEASTTTTGGTDTEGGSGGGGGGASSLGAKPRCEGEASSSATPSARADSAMALSTDGRLAVLFGGDTALPVCGSTPTRDHAGDTWLLDTACGDWLEVATDGPGARARHSMATDSSRGRALMFGGRSREGSSGPYTLFADVWSFDFEARAWSLVETTGMGPSPRYNAATAVLGDTLYVFGGSVSPNALAFEPSDELFALDLSTNVWSLVTSTGPSPAPRLFHAMAADTATSSLFVYGGGDENAFTGPFFDDTHRFDATTATWTELDADTSMIVDPGRIKLGLLARPSAATPSDEAPTLFAVGGHDDGSLGNRNDVLALDAASSSWRAARPGDTFQSPSQGQCDFPADFATIDAQSPERRSAFAFAALPSGNGFVVFGGDSDCGRLSDAWWFDATTEQWEPVRETIVGLVCPRTGNTECSGLCG
jgi:hypothetical protein